jgi:hypothetical protein
LVLLGGGGACRNKATRAGTPPLEPKFVEWTVALAEQRSSI